MKWISVFSLSLLFLAPTMAEETKPDDGALYSMDFEKEDDGYYPMDFLVLEGDFQVEPKDGNKVLTLPGQPLNTMGFLFGPTKFENIRVSAKFLSENVKRRYPRFGVGLCGVMGYKLRINQASRSLELYLGDDVAAKAPYKWTSGEWAHIMLQIVKTSEDNWIVQGKAWKVSDKEPENWLIEYTAKDEPISGRPTAWATPYSSKPIYIDDLRIEEVK